MPTCKEFLKKSCLAINDPDEDSELRWSLVLLRATMLVVPFWCRERVWFRMIQFLSYMNELEEEGDSDDLVNR